MSYILWNRSLMITAKVFMNGRSQAIRLPKQFRVRTREVFLKKTPVGFTVVERDPWEIFEEGCRELSDDFMSVRMHTRSSNNLTPICVAAFFDVDRTKIERHHVKGCFDGLFDLTTWHE